MLAEPGDLPSPFRSSTCFLDQRVRDAHHGTTLSNASCAIRRRSLIMARARVTGDGAFPGREHQDRPAQSDEATGVAALAGRSRVDRHALFSNPLPFPPGLLQRGETMRVEKTLVEAELRNKRGWLTGSTITAVLDLFQVALTFPKRCAIPEAAVANLLLDKTEAERKQRRDKVRAGVKRYYVPREAGDATWLALPINRNRSHWVTVILNKSTHRFWIMDPKQPAGVLNPGWLQEWSEFWEFIAVITGVAPSQASNWTYQVRRCPEQPVGNSWDCGPMCLAIILAILSGAHPNQLEYIDWVQCEAMGALRNELASSYRAYALSAAVLQWSRFKASWGAGAPATSPTIGHRGASSMKPAAGANGRVQSTATLISVVAAAESGAATHAAWASVGAVQSALQAVAGVRPCAEQQGKGGERGRWKRMHGMRHQYAPRRGSVRVRRTGRWQQ